MGAGTGRSDGEEEERGQQGQEFREGQLQLKTIGGVIWELIQ